MCGACAGGMPEHGVNPSTARDAIARRRAYQLSRLAGTGRESTASDAPGAAHSTRPIPWGTPGSGVIAHRPIASSPAPPLALEVDNTVRVKALKGFSRIQAPTFVGSVESDHPGQIRIREGSHESRRLVWFRVMRQGISGRHGQATGATVSLPMRDAPAGVACRGCAGARRHQPKARPVHSPSIRGSPGISGEIRGDPGRIGFPCHTKHLRPVAWSHDTPNVES